MFEVKKNLIVARYNESVDWIVDNRNLFNDVIIFNKGQPLDLLSDITVIDLPNIGRETHSYFYYLIRFYSNIKSDECYIFTQADPFDVSPNFLNKITDLNSNTSFPVALSDFSMDEPIVTVFWDIQSSGFPNKFPVGAYLHRMFYIDMSNGRNINLFNEHFFNGLHAARGDHLLFRSLKFYKNCMHMLPEMNNPIECHMFERLWQYIFNPIYLDWDTHYDKIRDQFVGNGHYYQNPIT
jgi:hypothetical protein